MNRAIHFAERLLRPADRLRVTLIRALHPLAVPVIRDRDLRIALAGSVAVAIALAIALGLPWWLLALGPVVWGVPHLVADVRYLVVRPGLHRRRVLWFAAGIPLLIAGCGLWTLHSGLVAVAAVALLCHGPVRRKVIALTAVAVLFVSASLLGDPAMILFAHAHNFIAVLLWWFWRPRLRPVHALVPLFFLIASAALLFGWLQPSATGLHLAPTGMAANYHFGWLAPGIGDPWALRLVVLFAFAQTVHYGVWLRLIPEEDRRQPTPRTFRASFRALHDDMGSVLLAAAFLLALAIAIWATVDLIEARATYLRLALFHGHLELAAAAFLFVEGWRSSDPNAC